MDSLVTFVLIWSVVGPLGFYFAYANSKAEKEANSKQKLLVFFLCGPSMWIVVAVFGVIYYVYDSLGDAEE